MKRRISGTVFDTATSTILRELRQGTVYQAPKGALFIVKGDEIEPLSRAAAERLIGGKVKHADSGTLYLRLPLTLKARIEAAAKIEGVPATQWALRALEAACPKT